MSVSKEQAIVIPGWLAVSPVVVFMLSYLVVSIIIGDFYKMPLTVAFLISSIWAGFTMKGMSMSERIDIFSKGASSSNIMYMIWIFILAGVFASVAKSTGAVEATVDLTLRYLPTYLLVPGLFIATCFISMSIGTSVGTVVALTPLAVTIADGTGAPDAYYVAIVLGGAFFGDNLSFISDTTIAATRTQGCDMRQKFLANIWIVCPAALIALVIYFINAPATDSITLVESTSVWMTIPYLLVIALAIAGINVIIVLLVGILAAVSAGLIIGMDIIEIMGVAGEGVDSVGSLTLVTILAAGMLGIIKKTGGIDYILHALGKNVNSVRGAQFCIVSLVGLVNICTANNTVAIITVGSLAKKISDNYGIAAKKTASLLDTGSCVVQSLIPYGAQTLMASSLAGISPVATWPYLYYPFVLTGCLIISILFVKHKKTRDIK